MTDVHPHRIGPSGEQRRTGERAKSEIPMLPGASALVGHAVKMDRDRTGFVRRMGTDGGDIFRIRLFQQDLVVVTSPALVQEVLVEKIASFEKSPRTRYVMYPVASEGLFISTGALWRRQRRLMAPIFQPEAIRGHGDEMVACAQRAVAKWRDGTVVDMARETTRIAMSVAGKTLFSTDSLSDSDELGAAMTEMLTWIGNQPTALLPALQTAVAAPLSRLGSRLPGPLGQLVFAAGERLHGPLGYWGESGRRFKDAMRVIERHVERMIAERRAEGLNGSDVLTRLLAARDADNAQGMSDKLVRDEVITIFFAGHETTADGLAWALYLLAQHLETLQRAREEADALGRTPRGEDAARLPYITQVFKEALRMYPPVTLFGREVRTPVTIGGYALPVGSVVLVSAYATHYRADLWPDPYRFDPERFSPEAEARRARFAYLPFSHGPRVCIGMQFALLEGPLVLATLLQRADFTRASTEEVVPEQLSTLRPRGGVPMRVHLRTPSV